MDILYGTQAINTVLQDNMHPLFCTKSVCKAIGIRNRKTLGTFINKYEVIKLATKRNRPEFDLFRKWFVNEFRLWLEPPKPTVHEQLPAIEELDEEDVANYIVNNCERR